MGVSGSTRRVVVEENDGSGVVKVSDAVVKRIRGDGETVHHEKSKAPSTSPQYDYPKRKVTVAHEDRMGSSGEAVEDIEAFYIQTLQELEQRNSELQRITNEQFVKAVQEVEQKFLKHTCSPVCQENQSKVYCCYLDNPKQTLNCSAQVRAFSTCVERARQNALLQRKS